MSHSRARSNRPFAEPSLGRVAGGAATAAAVAGLAWRAGSLAPSGAVAAVGVGTAAVSGGWRWGGLLLGFFVSSSGLSRWRRVAKAARTAGVVEKGGRRDARQVLANGGAFAALTTLAPAGGAGPASDGRTRALLGTRPGPSLGASALAGAAAGALAAAAADTWATEVGTAAGGAPRLVRGWRPDRWPHAAPGTSGAVTVEGTLALAAGAAAMSGGALLLGLGRSAAAGALAGGLAGAWADTLAGARVQERRWCDRCRQATEQHVHAPCGTSTRVRGGVAGLGNDGVNALCTLVGAAVGGAVGAAVGTTGGPPAHSHRRAPRRRPRAVARRV